MAYSCAAIIRLYVQLHCPTTAWLTTCSRAPPCAHAALCVQRPLRGWYTLCAASVSSNDFKPGIFIEVDGAPYRILGALRVSESAAIHPWVTSAQSTSTSSRAKGPLS
jgi:hypothetical protein